MSDISSIKLKLSQKLLKKDFRTDFFAIQAQDEIAMKLKELREKRGLTQHALSKKTKMKQSSISRAEQSSYSGWSFKTLIKLANALGAKLKITLEPFEDVIARYKDAEEAGDIVPTMPSAKERYFKSTQLSNKELRIPVSETREFSKKQNLQVINQGFRH